MSAINSKASLALWSTSDALGNLVEILSVKSQAVLSGTMAVRVTVAQTAGRDVEDIIYCALDRLIDELNACPEDSAPIFDAEQLRLHDRFSLKAAFFNPAPCQWQGKISWQGSSCQKAEKQPVKQQSLAEYIQECRRRGEAEYAFLRKATGKSNKQIERELTRRDRKGGA
jgi:predicted HicB family RNase H-like nuclease